MNKSRRPEVEIYRPGQNMKLRRSDQFTKASTSLESSETNFQKIELERNNYTHYVFYNDHIMHKIISYVINIKDRNNLELSCKRLLELSKKSSWLFNPNQRILILSFTTLNSVLTVQFGQIFVRLPCLTFENRRQFENIHDSRRKKQPENLKILLKKLTTKFGNYIENVIIGGRSEKDIRRGVDPHLLIVTKDLIETLNEIKCLKSLCLRECFIDEDALEFIASSNCKFKNSIDDVVLDSLYLEKEDDYKTAVNLISENVKRLTLKSLNISCLGKHIANKIKEFKINLNFVSITLNTVANVEETRNILSVFNQFCKCLEIHLTECTDLIPKNMFHLGRSIKNYQNIQAFTMNVKPKSTRDNIDLSSILEDLGELSNLETLTVGKWSDPNILSFLIAGVQNCLNLKTFSFLNEAMCKNIETTKQFFEVLPPKIENLEFKNFPIDNNVLSILEEKYERTLKKLTLTKPKKCFTIECYTKIIHSFKVLKSLSLDLPIPSTIVVDLLENQSIGEAKLVLENGCPLFLDVLFNDHFNSIKKTPLSIGPQGVLLELKHRKKTGSIKLQRKPLFIKLPEKKAGKVKEIW